MKYLRIVVCIICLCEKNAYSMQIEQSHIYNTNNLKQIFTSDNLQEQLDIIKKIGQEYESDERPLKISPKMLDIIEESEKATNKYLRAFRYCINNNTLKPSTQDKVLTHVLKCVSMHYACASTYFSDIYLTSEEIRQEVVERLHKLSTCVKSLIRYIALSKTDARAYNDYITNTYRTGVDLGLDIHEDFQDIQNNIFKGASIYNNSKFLVQGLIQASNDVRTESRQINTDSFFVILQKRYRSYEKLLNNLFQNNSYLKSDRIKYKIKQYFTQGDIQKLFDKSFI